MRSTSYYCLVFVDWNNIKVYMYITLISEFYMKLIVITNIATLMECISCQITKFGKVTKYLIIK